MKLNRRVAVYILFSFGLLLLNACSPTASQSELKVVATTSIAADVVAQVSGEYIAVDTLLPIGTDPHGFDPSPQDIAKVAEADLIFANGAGLEEFLKPLIESAGADDRMVVLTEGTDFIEAGEDHSHEDDHDEEEDEGEHEDSFVDPHTWTDPHNVLIWVDHIETSLSQLDPQHAEQYAQNAESYRQELINLDSWIREQVSQIPEEKRIIVSDHASFAYFARRYNFQQAGTLIPGFSTLAKPTAQELAALEDTITQLGIKAVFVGNTVNPSLAQRVVEDTNIQLVSLYTGSLSEPGGEADSYLSYIRYNVNAIVNALAPN
jgi:ABC-type Zn uptake system ZnuABC Zn-binding protein ZnuA